MNTGFGEFFSTDYLDTQHCMNGVFGLTIQVTEINPVRHQTLNHTRPKNGGLPRWVKLNVLFILYQ